MKTRAFPAAVSNLIVLFESDMAAVVQHEVRGRARASISDAVDYAISEGVLRSAVIVESQEHARTVMSSHEANRSCLVLSVGSNVYFAHDLVFNLVRRYSLDRVRCEARDVLSTKPFSWEAYTGETDSPDLPCVMLEDYDQWSQRLEISTDLPPLSVKRVTEPTARFATMGWTEPGECSLDAPLLTLLVRLSGNSPETLADFVTALRSQQFSSMFDVLFILNRPADCEALRGALDDLLVKAGSTQIKLSTSEGVVNALMTEVKTPYFMVMAEEDLVLADFSAQLCSALYSNPHLCIRLGVSRQRISPELWPGDQLGFRSVAAEVAVVENEENSLLRLLSNGPIAETEWVIETKQARDDLKRWECHSEDTLVWYLVLSAYLSGSTKSIQNTSVLHRYWAGGDSEHFLSKEIIDPNEIRQMLLHAAEHLGPGGLKLTSLISGMSHQLTIMENRLVELESIRSSRYWKMGEPLRGFLTKFRRGA